MRRPTNRAIIGSSIPEVKSHEAQDRDDQRAFQESRI